MGDSHHWRRVAARPWHIESRVHERHGQHFCGQPSALVKPYIAGMTQSELFAVMVEASVAVHSLDMHSLGPVEYLIAACFVRPWGLVVCQMLQPETETPSSVLEEVEDDVAPRTIDAAATGASSDCRSP